MLEVILLEDFGAWLDLCGGGLELVLVSFNQRTILGVSWLQRRKHFVYTKLTSLDIEREH
jgi:hypothetical protein